MSTKVQEVQLTSFDVIKSGLSWNWLRLTHECNWQDYHDGEFSSLYSINPTVENGLQIIENKSDITTPNLFKLCSDFYTDAIFAEIPEFISSVPGRQEFIDSLKPVIVKELSQAVRWRTIKGRGVLLVDSLGLRAIDPSNYFPLRDVFALENTQAHLLAYPYSSEVQDSVSAHQTADRIRFVFYDPSGASGEVRNDWQEYRFSGNAIGERLDGNSADVQAILTFGGGPRESYYFDAVDLIRDFSVRRAIIGRVLNRHGSPHINAPSGAAKDLRLDPKVLYFIGMIKVWDMNTWYMMVRWQVSMIQLRNLQL